MIQNYFTPSEGQFKRVLLAEMLYIYSEGNDMIQ